MSKTINLKKRLAELEAFDYEEPSKKEQKLITEIEELEEQLAKQRAAVKAHANLQAAAHRDHRDKAALHEVGEVSDAILEQAEEMLGVRTEALEAAQAKAQELETQLSAKREALEEAKQARISAHKDEVRTAYQAFMQQTLDQYFEAVMSLHQVAKLRQLMKRRGLTRNATVRKADFFGAESSYVSSFFKHYRDQGFDIEIPAVALREE